MKTKCEKERESSLLLQKDHSIIKILYGSRVKYEVKILKIVEIIELFFLIWRDLV